MFFEEGWASLADVTQQVTQRVQAFHAERAEAAGGEQPSKARILADTSISVWEICDAATKVGVTSGEGNLIPTSKLLITWDDPRKPFNRHLDVRLGSVGSAPVKDEPGLEAKLRARYGPFLYLPISVPINGVESSLSFLDEELAQDAAGDDAIAQVAAKIVAAFNAGQMLTRDIARRKFAADLTRRKFKHAWAAATDTRPALRALG